MDQRNVQSGGAAENFAVDALDAQEREKALRSEIADEQQRSAEFTKQLETRDAQVAELTARLAVQQARESELVAGLKEREIKVAKLLELSEAQEEWARELAGLFARQEAALERIFGSISWRITSPVRRVSRKFPRLTGFGRDCLKVVWWIVRGQFWRIPQASWRTVKTADLTAAPQLDFDRASKTRLASDIVLYTSYYTASSPERQREIDFCLERNVACKEISQVVLLVEDGRDIPINDPKITVIPNAGRLTYRHWIDLSEELPASTISLLANSDIYFDETIAELSQTLTEDLSFIALTRHDRIGSTFRPHPNPRWSQDAWAFKTGSNISDTLKTSLDIPLGVPRCDNKIAYLFALHGWRIVNPAERILATHVHETQARTYQKLMDASVIGAVAYVYPSEPFNNAAKLDFDIWTLNGAQRRPVPVGYNRSASRFGSGTQKHPPRVSPFKVGVHCDDVTAGGLIEPEPLSGVPPVLDISPVTVGSQPARPADVHFWQYPCLTEKDALDRHLTIAEGNVDPEQRIFHTYLGLPWATYIDRKFDFRDVPAIVRSRVNQARAFAKSRGFGLAVHTVCQHYAWWRIGGIFSELGVTDLHLSHCTSKSMAYFYGSDIRVHSWPLYAVNVEDRERTAGLEILKPTSEKRYLASFIGSYMTHYLSDVRLRLAEAARREGGPDILVELTDQWHFNPVVYDEQVKRRSLNRRIVDRHAKATYRYNQILSDSVFSLCPEGAGPNSLRLWESLAVGSIPVVVFDDWNPPTGGDGSPCFEDACVVLRTTEIDDLFSRLRRMAPSEIETRRQACVDLYNAIKAKLAFQPRMVPETAAPHRSREERVGAGLS